MITGIILASGFSSRMGTNKLLLDVEGLPMVERVIVEIKNSNVDDLLLIYQDEKVKDIGEKYQVKTVFNNIAKEGQSSSIKLGIEEADMRTKGFAFFVGDQPFLNRNVIDLLIKVFQEKNDKIVVPLYKGRRGNPVIFPSTYKDELLSLKGDVGGRKIIDKYKSGVEFVYIDNSIIGRDIDTIDDFKELERTVKEK